MGAGFVAAKDRIDFFIRQQTSHPRAYVNQVLTRARPRPFPGRHRHSPFRIERIKGSSNQLVRVVELACLDVRITRCTSSDLWICRFIFEPSSSGLPRRNVYRRFGGRRERRKQKAQAITPTLHRLNYLVRWNCFF